MRVRRWFGAASAVLLIVLASASPVAAGMAGIETATKVDEHSNDGVKAAVVTAVETAARGAKAMGLPQITVRGVRVLQEIVIVQILATDGAPVATPEAEPESESKLSL